jgi:RimJ/RimL family protein N-acetyltransferase
MTDLREVLTERLELVATAAKDTDELFPMFTDPQGWWHAPDSRHRDIETTRGFAQRAEARWPKDGLSYWTVRRRSDHAVVGLGGAQRHRTGTWNLSYRIATSEQGNGYALELSRAAIDAAHTVDPSVPVIAWIAPHNLPSVRVAERLGLTQYGEHVDLNDGETRLVYADRMPDF